MKLTQKQLKAILHYDPETGIFTWKIGNKNKRIKIGDIAGSKTSHGYIELKKNYAHRLAFLYMEGYIPEHQVDHINRIKDDNRWCNLRHVTQSCNTRNSKVSNRNTSGITGVYHQKVSNKWAAQITINDKPIYLGAFKKLTKAVYYRWKAEKKYNYPNCNSTSSAYLYLKNKGLIE